MSRNDMRGCLVLTLMLLLTSWLAMIPMAPEAEAAGTNQTTSGVLTGTETWSGSHTLTGDVEVAEGAQLVINAGTTINMPVGAYIVVKGSMCAGDASCGATQAGTGSPVRFIWPTASPVPNQTGRCYDPGNGLTNADLNCGEAILFESTIDQALTSLSHVTIDGAYGIPVYIPSRSYYAYGAMVFAGASFDLDHLTFANVNTSNVVAYDLAAPHISDSTFVLGNDEQGWDAAAVRAFDAGTGILSTFVLENSAFTGNQAADCGNNGGGRSLITAENSYIDMKTLSITQNAYGVFLKDSSGQFTNSQLNVKCNGIDTNGHKSTGDISHTLAVNNNSIITEEGAPLTAYDEAIVIANDNTLSGASEGSGMGIRDSHLIAHRNVIGPINGWNGMWIYGESDVVAENNSFEGAAKETILIGEYHYLDQGWNVPAPTKARIHFANNIIRNNTGTECSSANVYGGSFNCPAIHLFMSSGTFIDNIVHDNAGDGMRITGSIVNAQGNEMVVGEFAARVSHYDDNYGNKYASIAYFRDNTWNNATQIYNVTESRVAVQSEHIPNPGGGELYPVMLSWGGAECPYVQNECLQVPPTAEWKPFGMPLAMDVLENATTFTFADLTNFDLSKVHIQNQNSAWGVQVQKGELVRFRTMAKGNQVADAYIMVRDAIGNELYNVTTDVYGYTPHFTLPSNFHIDTNWNHLANDAGEDSCNDGIDNDGDASMDSADSDCGTSREYSKYSVWAYKFEKGQAEYSFQLTTAVDDVLSLSNLEPSITVNQPDGYSFKRFVELDGTAWDGNEGPYFNDWDSQWSQQGVIKQIQIKPPGVLDWDDAYFATDESGAQGDVTKSNHPFSTWSFSWDMSNDAEGDYTFEIRSFDGLDYSPTITRVYKLNTVAPTLYVDSPADFSSHDSGKVIFQGRATDPYNGIQGSDLDKIWFEISGPSGYTATTSTTGGSQWSWEWDFSALVSGEYNFTIWASDSDFCKGVVGECAARTMTLDIQNENDEPVIQITTPYDTERISADEETLIQGMAIDLDGQVTKVEFEITNQDGLIEQNAPKTLTMSDILPSGAWGTYWDTSNLLHDRQYTITARAFDGYDYSPPAIVTVTIDNPPDEGNSPPVFNATDWVEVIKIYCDVGSDSLDQCGGGASLNLTKYFYDADQVLTGNNFIVVNNPDPTVDDNHYETVIDISEDGIASFNPIVMRDRSSNIDEWSLPSVQFQCIDDSNSKISSLLVTFLVESAAFTYERKDEGAVSEDGAVVFSGEGRPGAKVVARLVDGDRSIGITYVGDNGLWEMEISGKEFNNIGDHEIVFEYAGKVSEPMSVQVGGDSDGMPTWVWIASGIVAVVLLGGLFVFFFVEFEDMHEEEMMDATAEVEAADPYAWAKKAEQTAAPAVQQVEAATPAPQPAAASQYPGWIWDAPSNSWVPDPNYPRQ